MRKYETCVKINRMINDKKYTQQMKKDAITESINNLRNELAIIEDDKFNKKFNIDFTFYKDSNREEEIFNTILEIEEVKEKVKAVKIPTARACLKEKKLNLKERFTVLLKGKL